MDRINDILNEIAQAAGERFGGKKRSELKDSDFLFPETKSFPIVTPADVPDAISNFGRMKGKMDYGTFLRKLYNMAKKKGPEFVAALPQSSKEQLGLKKKVAKSYMGNMDPDMMSDPSYTNFYELDRVNLASLKKGDKVRNINSACKNYGSEGYIEDIEDLPDYMGDVVVYKTTNSGDNWKEGDLLKKTRNQLTLVETAPEENDTEDSLTEYKQELFEMSLSSIKSIMTHSKNIIDAIEDENIKENLTETWLQGKIAITEDYMLTIHNFVMFSDETDDIESSQTEKTPDEETIDMEEFSPSNSQNKPGLWENIRRKKEKMEKSIVQQNLEIRTDQIQNNGKD